MWRRGERGRDGPGAVFARDADLYSCFSIWSRGIDVGVGEKEGIDLLFVRFVMVANCVSKGGECSWVVQ